jgi:sialic acid synthase SpsE
MAICIIPARSGSKRIKNKNIKKGEKFTKDNIKSIRPYHGLHPKYYEFVLNKKAKKSFFWRSP